MPITITNVAPAAGPLTTRIQVRITGTNFVSPRVFFGDQEANVTGATATQIDVLAPASNTEGQVDVTVRTRNGNATRASGFQYCDPVVTAVAAPVPPRGPEGGGTQLTITGNYFVNGIAVLIGGMPATNVTVTALTQLTATTAARPPGTGNVNVRLGTGVAQILNVFTFVAQPTVNAVQLGGGGPAHGPTAGGTAIRIDGANFELNAEVLIGGVAAANIVVPNANTITCDSPPHPASGRVDVQVRNPQGAGRTLANGFTYDVTVTGIAPASGPVAGGEDVVITGGGFGDPSVVTIGGVAATFLGRDSPTQVRARTPAGGALGPVNVDVQSGALTGRLANGYTYLPGVTAVTPNTGPSCGGRRVRIDGSGFANPATVSFGGAPATNVNAASATQIDCDTPAHDAGAVRVEVTIAGRTGGRDAAYTFAIPTVTSIRPNTARITGGRHVTITGTGFVNGANRVQIGGRDATSIQVVSATEVRCVAPARAAGTVDVTVANADNRPGRGVGLFTYVDGPTSTGDNEFHFLMDGEEYFSEFEALVQHLIARPQAALTYMRMAFWMAFPDMTLGAPGDFRDAGHTVLHWIDEIVQHGHNVDVVLWLPSGVEQLAMGGVAAANKALAEGIRDLDAVAATHPGWGRARAYLELYPGEIGASNHQKIVIFSEAGQRTVLLGGINLAHKYYDTVSHDFQDPLDNHYNHWHDTAVRIRGPATDDVELEWERRWDHAISQVQNRFAPNRSVIYARNLAGVFALTVDNSVRVAAVQIARNRDRQNAAGGSSGKIATTRSVGSTYYRELRDELLGLIGAANTSIYMENNQFTDPEIVRALYRRKAAVPALRIVILTNPQSNIAGFGLLTRRSWLQLALRDPNCGLVYYDLGTGAGVENVDAQTAASWDVQDIYDPDHPARANWFANERLRFKRLGGDPWTEVPLNKITRVDGDFYFYTTVRELGLHTLCHHSKLAIIDARYLVVGTSNWTFRSMQYDGEMAAFIDDGVLAAAVQARLLDHYHQWRVPLRADLARQATLANLETVADDTLTGLGHLGGVVDADYRDRYLIARLAYHVWPELALSGGALPLGDHRWI
jgi:phosphatidylserine/phosphatidylglycerophosphate/cardiolipin synthase-like enzyme